MVIMNKGKAVVQGNVHNLLNDQELVVLIETDNADLAKEKIHIYWPSLFVQTISPAELQCQVPKELISEINKVLVESGIKIYSVYYKRKLEDYFFKLTSN